MSEKLTKDEIAELAKKIHGAHIVANDSIESVVKTIAEWQTPEKDVLEGPWGLGGPDGYVYYPARNARVCMCEDEDLTWPEKLRIARAIVLIPQMVKLCHTIADPDTNLGGVIGMAESILGAIDNKQENQ